MRHLISPNNKKHPLGCCISHRRNGGFLEEFDVGLFLEDLLDLRSELKAMCLERIDRDEARGLTEITARDMEKLSRLFEFERGERPYEQCSHGQLEQLVVSEPARDEDDPLLDLHIRMFSTRKEKHEEVLGLCLHDPAGLELRELKEAVLCESFEGPVGRLHDLELSHGVLSEGESDPRTHLENRLHVEVEVCA